MTVFRSATRVTCSLLALNLATACLTSQPHKPAEVVYLGQQRYGRDASVSSVPVSSQARMHANIQTAAMDSTPAFQAAPVESVVTTNDLAPVSSAALPPPGHPTETVTVPSSIVVADTAPPPATAETIKETLNRPHTPSRTAGTLQLPEDYAPSKVYTLPDQPKQPMMELAAPPRSEEEKKTAAAQVKEAPKTAKVSEAAPVAEVKAATPAAAAPLPVVEAAKTAAPKQVSVAQFVWPAQGKVVSAYGANVNGSANDGITITLPEGTRVQSAADGTVVYAGNDLKAYGNLLIVRHADGWITSYANTSKIMVQKGDSVKQGQVIALSGSTGEAAQPQLHFGVRKGKEPVDPISVLQQDGTASLQASAKTPG